MRDAEHQETPDIGIDLTAGELLKNAREMQRLTHAEVADKLHLSEQFIRDLEVNDYTHIGARIYVRGYLLNYAKLLGIADTEILQAMQSSALPEENLSMQRMLEREVPAININLRPQYGRSHLSRWVLATFFIILAMLVAIWWENQKTHLYPSATFSGEGHSNETNASRTSADQSMSLNPASSSVSANSSDANNAAATAPTPMTTSTPAANVNSVSGAASSGASLTPGTNAPVNSSNAAGASTNATSDTATSLQLQPLPSSESVTPVAPASATGTDSSSGTSNTENINNAMPASSDSSALPASSTTQDTAGTAEARSVETKSVAKPERRTKRYSSSSKRTRSTPRARAETSAQRQSTSNLSLPAPGSSAY